ncbi:hypothetical protein CEUSTIGMA_g5096.t1 [Chlamydomonas eustigma]|uniref:CR-type domain-containing protein n=1 Tax=Chlamydomonas eustigma TaxID=1157962 RepID=A0A250X3J6_9CHLO|nr:hypothetical protein CEUSTIGMA_g5096.t1 [Chlamydomonas eustigma]|eukprot:GAX77653.1 hypothetical protein CEUSTIGMA_g5096.t1 [Chlamydomonas eustigma]
MHSTLCSAPLRSFSKGSGHVPRFIEHKTAVAFQKRTDLERDDLVEECCVIAEPPKDLNLVKLLLFGSASRVQRGTCSCLQCRGNGTSSCTECKSSGLLSRGNVARSEGGLTSNRCSCCHGLGHLICPSCNGSGLRFRGPDLPCKVPE